MLGGKLLLEQRQKFQDYLKTLKDGWIELSIRSRTQGRTKPQNAYYWAVIVRLIADHTGQDDDTVHATLKQKFCPKIAFADTVVPMSTKKLDKLQFIDYAEKCRVWAAEFFKLNIPLPGEYEEYNK